MRSCIFALALIFLTASGFGQTAESVQQAGQGVQSAKTGEPVTAHHFMVVTANPHATKAGRDVLRRGGNAIDAMVAVQLVLGLVEPQHSGLGGGGFLVYWDAKKKQLKTLDGRETAPMHATPRLFQDSAGQPLEFYEAVIGGRSVGVPGIPRLLEDAHRQWGQLPWRDLFSDAIQLAEEGFNVSRLLATRIGENKDRLSRYPETRARFLDGDGAPRREGSTLKNPAYARTLAILRDEGAAAFYSGRISTGIVETVRRAPGNPGVMTAGDLAAYQVKERVPVCFSYRGLDVCGMGPPSSGMLTVGQILGILENFDLTALGSSNPITWQLFG